MPAPVPVRRATLELLAACLPLTPDPARLAVVLTAPDLDWDDALYLADGHGLTPLLYALWSELDLLPRIPAVARARLEQAYANNAQRNADARAEFSHVLELLERARVESLVLKGLPLLLDLYHDPALRVLYDFDVVVRDRAQAQRGFDALLAAGYTPVPTKPGAVVAKHLPSLWRLGGFVRRGDLFDVAQPRPVELHLALWDSPWRGLELGPLPDLWASSRVHELDGHSFRVLSPEHTFVHLCAHLATHLIEREARAGQALDVGRFLAAHAAGLDWDTVLGAAAAARVSRLVYLAVHAASALTGAPLPPPAAFSTLAAQTPPRLSALAVQEAAADLLALDFRAPDLSRAYALTFAAASNWRERAGVLAFALLPPAATVRAEYGGRGPVPYARHLAARGRAVARSFAASRAARP